MVAVTYQEDDGDIETESDHCVGQKSDVANTVKVGPSHVGNLNDEGDNAVHNGASGGEVVQRDQGVHLELGRRKQALDHGQADSLEDDTGTLEQETEHDELNFTDRGNNDTNDDEGNVAERLHVGRRETHDPRGDQDSDGGGGLGDQVSFRRSEGLRSKLLTYLDHLDEGNREVEVGQVSANEREGEEDTNWDNCAEVDSAVHGHLLSRVQVAGAASQNLGHEGCKTKMPCGQENGEACAFVSCCRAMRLERDVRKASFFSSRMYLLNRMTLELMAIQTLRKPSVLSSLAAAERRNSHNVESRVNAALRRLRLLERRVDDGQNGRCLFRSLDLARSSFLLHGAKCGVSRLIKRWAWWTGSNREEAPAVNGDGWGKTKNEGKFGGRD